MHGENDYYVHQQYEELAEYDSVWAKAFQYEWPKDLLVECGPIDNVIVLGHNMGDVASEYMEQIEKSLQPVRWWIWQFRGKPTESNLSSYTRKDKVSLFDLELIEEK